MNNNFKTFLFDGRYGFFVAGAVLFVVYFGWSYMNTIVDTQIKREFVNVSENIIKDIEIQIDTYTNEIRAGAGLYSVSDFVSREGFSDFFISQDIFKKYPGIKALEYIERVSLEDKDVFTQKIRHEGFTEFSIKPPGNRDEYLVVNYIEPIVGNEAAFGFDLATNKDRLEALSLARDIDGFVITAPIFLVQDNAQVPAFLAMVPVYKDISTTPSLLERREALQGFVLGVFRYNDLFLELAEESMNMSGVHFALLDDSEKFFDSGGDLYSFEDSKNTDFQYHTRVEVGGRIWQFQTYVTDKFFLQFVAESLLPVGVLTLGVVLAIFLFFIFYLISRSRRRALELADRMTESFHQEKNKVTNINKDLSKALSSVKTSLEEKEHQQKATLNILEDVEEEKKKVSLEKEKIDIILHSIGDGVFVVDDEYRITVFNQVAVNISGFTAEEVLGKKYDDVLEFRLEDGGKENDSFIKDAITTGIPKEMANHTVLVRKDGIEVPVADSAAPLKDTQGNVIGCVVVFRDVSREREIDKAKTEFVSLASHQLRTPLSTINWFTEMLLDNDAGKLNKEQRSYIEEVYKGNKRMVDLVNALLNVSRIELGTLAVEPEPTDLRTIMDSAIEELTPSATKKKIKIETEYDKNIPVIQLDKKMMRVALQNLISNAVKYTPEKGTVTVAIEVQKKDVRISVTDTGYGIPKDQQDQIFVKLFRADNVREHDVEGTGLGLYIVKAIIEQSGGTVGFESPAPGREKEVNKGTLFYCTIPLSGMKKKGGAKGLEVEKVEPDSK